MATSDGFSIDMRLDVQKFIDRARLWEREHVPFVTAYAITKTAQDIKEAEVKSASEVFDRPTRFTLNAFYVKPATKQTLTGGVFFKEGFSSIPAYRYLGPQVEGGKRKHKSHEKALIRANILRSDEFVIPGYGVRLDANGNMRGGEITRILSALKANPDAHQNTTARSQRRAKRTSTYVVMRGVPNLRDGVYERKSRVMIRPVMIFVKAPHYQKRFPFYKTAWQVALDKFPKHFAEGWQRYVIAKFDMAA